MAASDMIANAQFGPPAQSNDTFYQAIQTSAVKRNVNMGPDRILQAHNVSKDRIIGGDGLQDYDPRLDGRKGNLVVLDAALNDQSFVPGMEMLDTRPSVYYSLAGFVVPAHITSERAWRQSQRVLGFLAFDDTISAAENGNAANYGSTLVTGGSMGHGSHVAPENITAGTYLYADVGPRDPAARRAWHAQMRYNRNGHIEGSEKPVLRAWNPLGAYDLLTSSFNEFFAVMDTTPSASTLEALISPSKFDLDSRQESADRAAIAAVGLYRPIAAATVMNLALLQQAGYITINPTPAVQPSGTDLFALDKVTTAQKTALAELTSRLGLEDGLIDPVLCKAVFGSFWQPLTESSEIASVVSIERALPNPEQAKRLQEESAPTLIATILDAQNQNLANIVAKATHNSTQGNEGMKYVVCP